MIYHSVLGKHPWALYHAAAYPGVGAFHLTRQYSYLGAYPDTTVQHLDWQILNHKVKLSA